MDTNRKIILWSMLHSLVLLMACYWLWNLPYAFDDEAASIRWFNTCRQYFDQSEKADQHLLLVNTAYDRVLVSVVDEYGIPKGNIDITDREKLLCLLQAAKANGNYRYIFLDIYFNPAYSTDTDSALFQLISTMPRIVVPCHQDEAGTHEQIQHKSALSDYATSLNEGSFLKYKFLYDKTRKSLPLYAYHELTGKNIRSCCGMYFCDGSLCTNSIILDFAVQATNEYTADGEKLIYQLGSDLVDVSTHIDLPAMMEGRDILIGDFTENDLHDTVAGTTSGSLINYNAFLALMNNRHLVSWGIMATIFLLLCVASYISFSDVQFIDYLPHWKMLKLEWFRFMLTWIGFATILTVVCFVFYWMTGKMVDILVITTYFTLLDTIIASYRIVKNKDKQ